MRNFESSRNVSKKLSSFVGVAAKIFVGIPLPTFSDALSVSKENHVFGQFAVA